MSLRSNATLTRSASALAATLVLAGGLPAGAQAACEQAPTTQAFAKLGDTAEYSVAPGGTFEAAAGWTFTGGGKIAYGNETVGITPGSKSLLLPIGATATSPAFCVDESNPYFRFVAKPSKAIAGYKAIVLYRNSTGSLIQSQFTSSKDASWGEGRWSASAVSPLATKIPLGPESTASVQIRFVSTGNQVAVGVGWWGKFTAGSVGTVSIDSVMVDPYRRG